MPLDFPGQIVKLPQVLSHLLLMVNSFPLLQGRAVPSASPERHNGETPRVPLHFPDQIVEFPDILSHLLLVVAIFPLPHPCAIRFPKSNRQTPTSPLSSALWWLLFSFFSFYIIFLLCLPLCLSVVSPRGGVCNCSPSRPF